MSYLNKKGKDPSVQGLVFLIAVMIVLYVLVLPPCDKCKLLGKDCPDDCEAVSYGKILLQEHPGDIGEVEEDNVRHLFDSADLFGNSDPNSRVLSNSLEVKSGLFGSLDQTLDFRMDGLENLDVATLSFAILEAKGNLILTLNGKPIFNQELDKDIVKEIELPVEYLEEENNIELRVNPPGFAFWMTNKYLLKDIHLNENYEKSQTSDVLEFSVSSSERNSIQDSDLDFYIFCRGEPGIANIMKVYLNDNLLFSELVPCINEEHSVDVEQEYFESGINELEFTVSGGNYLVSDIVIDNEIAGDVYPSYTFYISEAVYDGEDHFYLFLDMYGDNKMADIIINDYVFEMDTSNTFKEYDISNKLKEGNNYIEVRPLTEFRIDELRIYYE
jgi:hypothetical protein